MKRSQGEANNSGRRTRPHNVQNKSPSTPPKDQQQPTSGAGNKTFPRVRKLSDRTRRNVSDLINTPRSDVASDSHAFLVDLPSPASMIPRRARTGSETDTPESQLTTDSEMDSSPPPAAAGFRSSDLVGIGHYRPSDVTPPFDLAPPFHLRANRNKENRHDEDKSESDTSAARSSGGRSVSSLSHASSTTKYLIRTLEDKIRDQNVHIARKDEQIFQLMCRISEAGSTIASNLSAVSVPASPSAITIDVSNNSEAATRSVLHAEALALEEGDVTEGPPEPTTPDSRLLTNSESHTSQPTGSGLRWLGSLSGKILGRYCICSTLLGVLLFADNRRLRDKMARTEKSRQGRLGERCKQTLKNSLDMI